MVSVLALSDEVDEGLYADPRIVQGAELILACGDLPFDYLAHLMNVLDLPLVFVPGNHDPDVQGYRTARSGMTMRAGLPAEVPWPPGAENADGRVLDVLGLRIAGLGGSPRYSSGPNQYGEREQARRARALTRRARWRRARDGREVDVLLTHAPPRGVGDADDLPHRGFDCLLGLAPRLHTRLLLHGHVHPYGEDTPDLSLGGTLVRNVVGRHLFEVSRPEEGHMSRPTGFPRADAENDFLRMRRRQVLARLAHRLRRGPDDINLVLPFDEVVAALGRRSERSLGLQTIRLDTVVGTVDTKRDFDRRFRPTSSRVRERWERLALAQARGEAMPPIDVYRIGDLHFVRDGHHRVSIAMAHDLQSIDAYVTDVQTVVPARGIKRRGDLITKDYERMFRARVPLSPQAMAKIEVSDPWSYAELGENVEAWGYRCMQGERHFLGREEVARRWFAEEYTPVVKMLREAELLGARTDAEAYMAVASERYRLIRTHEWTDDVVARLRERRDLR